MTYTLDEIYTYVRLHLDLDSSELDDLLLAAWCREATTKIVHGKQRWPFLEASWDLAVVGGTAEYVLADMVNDDLYSPSEITSILASDLKLQWIGRDEAERRYLPVAAQSGPPEFWSVWNGTLCFYPTPASDATYTVRGYRHVLDWVLEGSGASPDLPDEFHDCVRLYVLASAYMQQEDSELASNYFSSFEDEMTRLKKSYGEMPPAQPFIMGGGPRSHGPVGRLRYSWEY